MKRVPVYILGLALLAAACNAPGFLRLHQDEKRPEEAIEFDPLAAAVDREVVPEVYPLRTIRPGLDASLRDTARADSAAGPIEVFRVEIFTSRLYGEANRELAIAREIFSLPIHLDYEVPYYRLRVGDFSTRTEAERMIESIRSIGYPNPWVARAIRKSQPPPALDTLDRPIIPMDTNRITPADRNPGMPLDERENR